MPRWNHLLTLIAVMTLKFTHLQSACPWNSSELLNWSNPATWDSGAVPGENEEVVIPTGKRVLLNIQPPILATLSIRPGAGLVWADVDGIILQTQNILVEGEFHIGSEGCLFNKKANIKLYGLSNSFYVEIPNEFGRKYIGVPAGGTLELHGKKKTSWTRLAQTIPAATDIQCGLVYDHSDHKTNLIGEERQTGLHVIVWNEDGSIFDFAVFSTYVTFPDFFTTIPDSKVIAMFAFGNAGVGSRTNTKLQFENLDSTLITLGSRACSGVNQSDSFAFIVRKGSPTSALENCKMGGQMKPDPDGFLHLVDWGRGLVFQVANSSSVLSQYFRVVSTDMAYPVLTLADEVVGWEAGDEIVVASTNFDWKQAEVRKLIPCTFCSSRQVRVNDTFTNMHFGNFTFNVDERAEVGILSRSIVIEGVTEAQCYANNAIEKKLCARYDKDTFGGHIKIQRGHASAHFEGVELVRMGQQSLLAKYPIHFHMCDEVPGEWVRDNSIHHSFSRCVTIHGTHNLEVSGNVCYDHIGHGFFLEDSVEQNNILDRNLAIGTRYGTLLMSDSLKDWCKEDYPAKDFTENCQEIAAFWITHPNNVITNNAAAGGDGHGYKIVYADLPLGPSYARQLELGKLQDHRPWNYPFKKFDGNTAHSNLIAGMFVDSKISTGRLPSENGVPANGILQVQNDYDPRDPPLPFGQRVWSEITRMTFYKNVRANMWLKGGNIRLSNSTLADSPQGFSGGNTNTDTATEILYSIFIGQTENTGQRSSNYSSLYDSSYTNAGSPRLDTVSGVSVYQGPNFIKSSYFDRFNNVQLRVDDPSAIRYSAAISWKRANAYPSMTSSYLQNITFGYCDNVNGGNWVFHGNASISGWEEMDGNLGPYVRDADGSVTGLANASLVRNLPIYTGPECIYHDNWGMSVCPYRYIKMEILGDGGNLDNRVKDKYPMYIRRDDPPYDVPLLLQGTRRNEYLLRTYRSYLIDFNPAPEGAAFPDVFNIFGYGVEKGDVVRVGLCQPLDVKGFSILAEYPALIKDDPTWASSLEELDADTTGRVFYHDKVKGILFFKVLSNDVRTNDSQQCPAGLCFKVKITVIGGDKKNMRSCYGVQVPAFPDTTIKPLVPISKPCAGPASPQGLGVVDWTKVPFVSLIKFSVPCKISGAQQGRQPVQHLGCFAEKEQPDLIKEPEEYGWAMTRQWCANRCYLRSYPFAALTRGKRCLCGAKFNPKPLTLALPSDCNGYCSNSTTETCGGVKFLDVLSTGKV